MQMNKGDSKSLAPRKSLPGYKSDMKRAAGHARPPFNGKGQRLIDKGIAREVRVLWENGINTFESCEGSGNFASYTYRRTVPSLIADC
jgi:hypothetical protein